MKSNNEKKIKLQLDLSVSELAYIVRILIELGIVKNKSKAEVYSWCCENIATKKAEDISFNALKNKCNVPQNLSIIKVGKLIKEMYSLAMRDQYKYLS